MGSKQIHFTLDESPYFNVYMFVDCDYYNYTIIYMVVYIDVISILIINYLLHCL